MLRAATAASGGTGAPLATYCSIWAWTVRISAWTSRPSGLSSGSSSIVARRYGSVAAEAEDAQAALALDDRPDRAVLELDDLGDLGQGADGVELGGVVDVLLLGLALGDERDGPALGDRGVERVDALLAADLERDDHLREDDGLPERDERELARVRWTVVGCSSTGVDGRLAIEGSPRCAVAPAGSVGVGVASAASSRPFGIEGFEDASAEALLEFEQDPDAGEVHAALPGQVADPGEPPDVVLAVEPDVGSASGPGRAGPRPRRCEGSADARSRGSPPR